MMTKRIPHVHVLSVAAAFAATACGRDTGTASQVGTADGKPVAALAYWAGLSGNDLNRYPTPTAVATVPRAADIPRIALTRAGGKPLATTRNQAVELEVLATGVQPGIFAHAAPGGSQFFVVETRWRNIHSKQRMEKGASEGKMDRTMGVGTFAGGRSAGGPADSVDMDVAYQIPNFFDHVYLVADGLASAIHPVTPEIPGGAELDKAFTLPKLGDTRETRFAFTAPANAKNVALQFLDYEYGHVLVPLRGDAKRAAGDGRPPGKVLARAETPQLDLAAHALAYAAAYKGATAPGGWRYAVVQLGGRSKSASGDVRNIVQIDPVKFIWLEADGGYVYPAVGGSTTSQGVLRFTPEIYQLQEVAFLIPANAGRFQLGLRAENDVARLALTGDKPAGLPRARGTHKDGNTMEVMLFGSRREGAHLILDLGIRPLDSKGQGIEIQADQQFLLISGGAEVSADPAATAARLNRPPQPFVVPPGAPVRFELAFPVSGTPTELKVRGFDGEGRIRL